MTYTNFFRISASNIAYRVGIGIFTDPIRSDKYGFFIGCIYRVFGLYRMGIDYRPDITFRHATLRGVLSATSGGLIGFLTLP